MSSAAISQEGVGRGQSFACRNLCGVQYKLETTCPDKKFYFTETVPVCKNMKKVFLEKVLHVLKTGENEVHVTDETRENAKRPLERMLELAK